MDELATVASLKDIEVFNKDDIASGYFKEPTIYDEEAIKTTDATSVVSTSIDTTLAKEERATSATFDEEETTTGATFSEIASNDSVVDNEDRPCSPYKATNKSL